MLCKEGRVEGAIYKGVWLIPRSAKKPEDPRRINKKRDDMDSNIRGILVYGYRVFVYQASTFDVRNLPRFVAFCKKCNDRL